MSMSHKAYAFDWDSFCRDELCRLLPAALEAQDQAGLIRYIERHRELLKDPYEGEALGEDWNDLLENRDVHEYGDFALTRFYDPAVDYGIGDPWSRIGDLLPEEGRAALLGSPIGSPGRWFDPGRYGSYFQPPGRVAISFAYLRGFALPQLDEFERDMLARFVGLLGECVEARSGLYTTF
jgi:hypothetical protein